MYLWLNLSPRPSIHTFFLQSNLPCLFPHTAGNKPFHIYLFVPSPFGPDLIKQAVVPPDGSNYWNANIQQQRETDEGEDRDGDKKSQRLDLASESELILTWNHRLNLKRNRVAGVSLDDVEEELIKRKKMKKESWFDDDGKLICVTVSSVLGNQTFMVDEEGGLRPNSP